MLTVVLITKKIQQWCRGLEGFGFGCRYKSDVENGRKEL